MNVAVDFAQILKIFARIMANFSAMGMRPHPHAVRVHAINACVEIWKTGLLSRYKNEIAPAPVHFASETFLVNETLSASLSRFCTN